MERFEAGAFKENLRNHAIAGVYLWAAESLHYIGEGSNLSQEFLEEARSVMPHSSRLRELEMRLRRA